MMFVYLTDQKPMSRVLEVIEGCCRMELLYKFEDIPEKLRDVVLTIGNFDGIHVGHDRLLRRVKELSKKFNLPSVVVTFFPHPRTVLGDIESLKSILTLEETIKLLKNKEIDFLIVINFTRSLSMLSPENFWESYIQKYLQPKYFVVGEDHRFGRNKEGDHKFFKRIAKKNNIVLELISPVYLNGIKVSSTIIRQYLKYGKLDLTRLFLGRHFSITSKVVKGFNRGSSLGYPTANFELKNRVIPPFGIYATNSVLNNKSYPSVTYIGHAPTFFESKVQFETHLISFSQMIYDYELKVRFLKKLRNEKRFRNIAELIKQIEYDIKTSLWVNRRFLMQREEIYQ